MRPRSSTKRGLVLGALLALLAGSSSEAGAASPDRCQADAACHDQTQQAAQLANKTLYEEALALYQSAYDRVHEPRLLVNIGRCHFRLGRARKALEHYDAFQKAMPDADPQLMSRLGQFIAEARLAIAADTDGPPGDDKRHGTRVAVQLFVPDAPPAEEPPPAALVPGRTFLGRPLYRVIIGASMFGLGAISLGLGIGALANNGQCVSPSNTTPGQCSLDIHSDGTASTRVLDGVAPGVPLLLIGAGLAAGGIALVALPPRRAASSTKH